MPNICEPQPSNSEQHQQLSLAHVERPKGVWFVCLLIFLLMSLVLRAGERYLASGETGQQNPYVQIFALGVLLAIFLMVHGILFLKPLVIKAVIGVFAFTALLGAYQFIVLMIQEGKLYLGILAIRVIPAALAAWYLARPSFIELSKRYNKHRERKAMEGHIQKRFLKR